MLDRYSIDTHTLHLLYYFWFFVKTRNPIKLPPPSIVTTIEMMYIPYGIKWVDRHRLGHWVGHNH